MSIVSILVGLLAGIITYLFAGYVGTPQPLLAIVSVLVFVLVAFAYHRHGKSLF